ncbi:MAG TPA: phenylalanine--tRNA ligase beta subunit-related protein [Vicinamibacterales bacterium]|nr:phenylalanine--tRNA ligase beta subunit-related protein [Vicinamibacterales bacterium]
MSRFSVAADVGAVCRPAVAWLEGAHVLEREPRLTAQLAEAESQVRQQPPAEVAAVRTMYKRVGLDPTKTRPSSEALLRRVRKGDPLPRINSLVDVCNWCSLEFQLPYGLYDAAHVEGAIELRLGREGESYPGIRKDDVHVGGRLTLADARGPFGNPTSDSARTMVTTATVSAIVVVFAPVVMESGRLARVLDVTVARMSEFTGCRETARYVGAAF